MASFPLKIVCPDGVKYDGQAQQLTVRTTSGELGILARHTDCVAPLGMGRAAITVDGNVRYGACIGGMVSVLDGCVTLVPTTFEWAEEIDPQRVEAALVRAQKVLENKAASKAEIILAEARLKRALIRKSVASSK